MKILDPTKKKWYPVNSKKGKSLLNKYMHQLGGSGGMVPQLTYNTAKVIDHLYYIINYSISGRLPRGDVSPTGLSSNPPFGVGDPRAKLFSPQANLGFLPFAIPVKNLKILINVLWMEIQQTHSIPIGEPLWTADGSRIEPPVQAQLLVPIRLPPDLIIQRIKILIKIHEWLIRYLDFLREDVLALVEARRARGIGSGFTDAAPPSSAAAATSEERVHALVESFTYTARHVMLLIKGYHQAALKEANDAERAQLEQIKKGTTVVGLFDTGRKPQPFELLPYQKSWQETLRYGLHNNVRYPRGYLGFDVPPEPSIDDLQKNMTRHNNFI